MTEDIRKEAEDAIGSLSRIFDNAWAKNADPTTRNELTVMITEEVPKIMQTLAHLAGK